MNQRHTAIAAKTAGLAHRAAYPSDRECADLLGVHRTTPHRWAGGDPANPMHKYTRYLLDAIRPWESLAHFQSIAKWKVIVKLSDDELIERYWELVEREQQIEGADNAMGHQPGHAWLDRAQSKKSDAAIELELAAVMTEFAARGMTEQEVREWV